MTGRFLRPLVACLATLSLAGLSAAQVQQPTGAAGRTGQIRRNAGSSTAFPGAIIGDRNTKVYHLTGDTRLPMAKNRVYFHSEAEARAAGFRVAKTGGRSVRTHRTSPMRDPKTGRFIKNPQK